MDPNQTLDELLQAIHAGDREDTAMLLDDLLQWLESEGFMPLLHKTGCCGAYEVEFPGPRE